MISLSYASICFESVVCWLVVVRCPLVLIWACWLWCGWIWRGLVVAGGRRGAGPGVRVVLGESNHVESAVLLAMGWKGSRVCREMAILLSVSRGRWQRWRAAAALMVPARELLFNLRRWRRRFRARSSFDQRWGIGLLRLLYQSSIRCLSCSLSVALSAWRSWWICSLLMLSTAIHPSRVAPDQL